MKKILTALLLIMSFAVTASDGGSRLKDLVTIKGVRENPILGYGLVIGLNGTGDSNLEITNQALVKMFQKLGLNPSKEITSKNVASVIVTAKLPPFARAGQKLDVTISSIGDSESLAGGTLLVTPLKGGDNKVYAVANGAISIGGLKAGSKFATTGSIPGGAVVENELPYDFHQKSALRLNLINPDFTTAARIEKTINENLGGKYASARDASTIDLIIPVHYQRKVVELVAIVENYKVHSDQVAKIVINEKTGTIVAGGDVVLKAVAISHGDLSIQIGGDKKKESKNGSLYFVENKTTLKDLVDALNAFGATPEDLISIFQALKKSGSLIGEIELI